MNEVDSDGGEMITSYYYNRTKSGVDILDKILRQYSSRAATRKWPVVVFCNISDITALDAGVFYWSIINPRINLVCIHYC